MFRNMNIAVCVLLILAIFFVLVAFAHIIVGFWLVSLASSFFISYRVYLFVLEKWTESMTKLHIFASITFFLLMLMHICSYRNITKGNRR